MNFVANELTVDNASIVGFGYHLMKRTAVMNIAQLYQTGVGLPDRDYYFKSDATLRFKRPIKKVSYYIISTNRQQPSGG
jgi:putative endopeptidase